MNLPHDNRFCCTDRAVYSLLSMARLRPVRSNRGGKRPPSDPSEMSTMLLDIVAGISTRQTRSPAKRQSSGLTGTVREPGSLQRVERRDRYTRLACSDRLSTEARALVHRSSFLFRGLTFCHC